MSVALAFAPATAADLDAIDQIERASFPSPWPRETFAAELEREWARLDVARAVDRIAAFCNYWLVPPELHVLAIATDPALRGQGIGAAMLGHVLAAGSLAGCRLATLEVRRGNTAAIALYTRAGFRTVHVRARYYHDDEDALVMLRGLAERE